MDVMGPGRGVGVLAAEWVLEVLGADWLASVLNCRAPFGTVDKYLRLHVPTA
jgi:hypothetical protein